MRLSLLRQAAYGLGGLPSNISINVNSFYLNFFLLEVALLDPLLAGNLLLVVNIFDAFSDPITGVLSDKTATRWGRRRPWMAAAVPLMAASYILQWQVWPALADGQQDPGSLRKLAYYLPIICLGRLSSTMWSIPHAALVMDMSESEADRVRLTFLRVASSFLAIIVGLVVVGGILAFFGNSRDELISAFGLSAYVLAAVIAVSGALSLVSVFEKPADTVATYATERVGFFRGLRIVFRNRAYVLLMLAACGCYASLSLVQNNLLMYADISLGIADFTPVMIVLILSTIAFMFLTNYVISRWGKKVSFFAGVVGLCATYFLLYFHPPGLLWLSYLVSVLTGFGLSTITFVPMVMLPDVIDLDELGTGERREGIFYAYMVFIEKVATGVTLAVSNYALEIAGYDASYAEQPRSVDVTLRVLVSFVPLALTFLASTAIFFYPVSERSREEGTALLVERREERVFSNKAYTFFLHNSAKDSSSYALLERGGDEPSEVVVAGTQE